MTQHQSKQKWYFPKYPLIHSFSIIKGESKTSGVGLMPSWNYLLVLIHGFLSSLISATFVVFTLITSLLNMNFPLLSLTYYFSPKLSCLIVLIANLILYSFTVSILNFPPKTVIVFTCSYVYSMTFFRCCWFGFLNFYIVAHFLLLIYQ